MGNDDSRPKRSEPRFLSDSGRRRHSGAVPIAVPSHDTSPIELLDEPPSDAELRFIRRLRRDSDDPSKLAEHIGRIAYRIQQRDISDSETMSRQAEELRELLNRPPNGAMADLQKRSDRLSSELSALRAMTDDHSRAWKFSKVVIGTVLAAALGSLGVGLGALWGKAEHEGEVKIRLQRLEDDVQLLLHEQRHRKDTP